MTATGLASAVPPVAGWRDTGVPRGVAATDVERLLDSCDRADAGGLRDLAILTLVARLGLRSAEVARLELGDLDWRAGEIVVRGNRATSGASGALDGNEEHPRDFTTTTENERNAT